MVKASFLILEELFGCDLEVLLVCLGFGGYNMLFLGGCGPNPDEDPDVTAEGPGDGNETKSPQGQEPPSHLPHESPAWCLGKICIVPRGKSFFSLEKPKELSLALVARGGW